MEAIDIGVWLLLLHAVLGGFDTLYNHEWDARLPRQPYAGPELALHAGRSALYVLIFGGVAWFEWHGLLVLLLALLVVAEFSLSLVDSVVEDRTRRLSRIERMVHLVLGVTTGAWAAFVFTTGVTDWLGRPTALVPTSYGAVSWLLTAAMLGAAASSLRDALAARRLTRAARFGPPPDMPPEAEGGRPAYSGGR